MKRGTISYCGWQYWIVHEDHFVGLFSKTYATDSSAMRRCLDYVLMLGFKTLYGDLCIKTTCQDNV